MEKLAVMLTALYLRGPKRPAETKRCAWPDVNRALRRAACDPSDAPDALRHAGFWAEALVLEHPGLLDWARVQVENGRALSAVDGDYPCRWLRVLGSAAPPVLWKVGAVPPLPCLSIVGSRLVPASVSRFCTRVAEEAGRLGYGVVSGRAAGCDRAAARGACSLGIGLVEILPHGINGVQAPRGGCLLSLCAPYEPFSAASAMERNALIYAASSHTVVGQARFKEGGTWHGAIGAARSRLSTLVVRRSSDAAMRSLASLGGIWLDSPSDLGRVLKLRGPQGELFGGAL